MCAYNCTEASWSFLSSLQDVLLRNYVLYKGKRQLFNNIMTTLQTYHNQRDVWANTVIYVGALRGLLSHECNAHKH